VSIITVIKQLPQAETIQHSLLVLQLIHYLECNNSMVILC